MIYLKPGGHTFVGGCLASTFDADSLAAQSVKLTSVIAIIQLLHHNNLQ